MKLKLKLKQWLRYSVAAISYYSGLDALYRRMAGPGLVVLMLHRVRDAHDPYPLSTSCTTLRQLVQWLRSRNALVSLDDGLRTLATSCDAHVNYALTFDDGYRDNLHLLEPELQDVPAVIYVATDHIGGGPIWAYRIMEAVETRTCDLLNLDALGIGHFNLSDLAEHERLYTLLPACLKSLHADIIDAAIDQLIVQLAPRVDVHANTGECRQMLDWNEVRQLHARGVMIGGHTRKHVILSRVEEGRARDEILGSHQRIEAELGTPPAHFAYPNGCRDDFGERDIRLVRDAGYVTAVSTIDGVNRPGVDPFRLLRRHVDQARFNAPWGGLSPALFFSETSGLLGWLQAQRAA